VDITLKAGTLVAGKGALGTWRSQAGQRHVSEEPAFADEPEGKRGMSGVYASQRLSFLMVRKAVRGKPGSEPSSGHPTVRDRRGGLRKRGRKSRAPQFYPDPGAHLVRIHAHFPLASLEAGFNTRAGFDDPRQLWQRRLLEA